MCQLARLDCLFQPYITSLAASLVHLAGVPGFEPGLSVLETDVLTVDTIPLRVFLLGLFVISMLAATATEFAEFQPVRSRLLVFGRNVITTLTVLTLKYDIVARHNSNSPIPISDLRSDLLYFQISFSSDLSLVQIFAS